MKRLISTHYSSFAFNLATFVLRATLGVLMVPHGYNKLVHFAEKQKEFMNFLGIGSTTSLVLVVFAEFFCAIFLVMGLFTRVTAAILAIVMAVAVFKAHNGEVFGDGEMGMLFLGGFISILLLGGGKASLDGLLSK
ncbi:MAG: DoxX family protein [Sphingobacteriales bacterium]|jgi:putative oxidoreductase